MRKVFKDWLQTIMIILAIMGSIGAAYLKIADGQSDLKIGQTQLQRDIKAITQEQNTQTQKLNAVCTNQGAVMRTLDRHGLWDTFLKEKRKELESEDRRLEKKEKQLDDKEHSLLIKELKMSAWPSTPRLDAPPQRPLEMPAYEETAIKPYSAKRESPEWRKITGEQ